MTDKITIQAQLVKAQTTVDGALRVTMDIFGADDMGCGYMMLLAKDQKVIEFTPKEIDE